MNEQFNNSRPLLVVKLGSSSVSDPENGMDRDRLSHCAEQVAGLLVDYDVVLGCSGSINTGKAMRKRKGKKPFEREQDYAGVGSGRYFVTVQEVFEDHGIETAQVPVTNHEIDSIEGQAYEETLFSYTSQGAVPVINGSDVMSNEGSKEYAIDTDNDRLVGHTAELTMANFLILLTDRQGLLDGKDVIREVDVSDISQVRYAKSLTPRIARPGDGRGGMRSKVTVAVEAAQNNTVAFIADARDEYKEVLAGNCGTRFFDSRL